MKRGAYFLGALIAGTALASTAIAKKPVAADEAVVRNIVKLIYADYSRPMEELFPEVPEGEDPPPDNPSGSSVGGYEPPYSKSLAALLVRWEPVAQGDELRMMNGFDWYCQCQDFYPPDAKMVSETYDARGKDKIDAKVKYAPTGGLAEKMVIRFIRENGAWVIDDLVMAGGLTLRKGLQSDISDAAKDAAKAEKN